MNRSIWRWRWCAALAVLLAGCATTSDAKEDEPVSEEQTAKPPFPAEMIRAATAPGRTFRFRVEVAGKPEFVQVMRFTKVDDERATVVGQRVVDGQVVEETEDSHTWEEFEGHATYPKAGTTIEDAEVEVPAGKFQVWLYTVTRKSGGHEEVVRAWFAKTLPGPPVRHVIERDGQQLSKMELLEHVPGARQDGKDSSGSEK